MTAIQQVTTVEEVDNLFIKWMVDGLTYDEISDMLKMRHPDIRGLSSMSVRRFCSMNKIGKKCTLSKIDLRKKVFEMQLKVF